MDWEKNTEGVGALVGDAEFDSGGGQEESVVTEKDIAFIVFYKVEVGRLREVKPNCLKWYENG